MLPLCVTHGRAGNETALEALANMADSGRYYSVAEAAARLGVSRVGIWRWVRAGRLPAAHLAHRTIRIHERDLDRMLVPATFGRGLEFRRSQEPQTDEFMAPRARVRQVQSSEHVVQFYEADGFLVSAVSDYLGSALSWICWV
jgi:excisionase family DNA binding protein